MKWTMAVGLTLMAVCCACETQVKTGQGAGQPRAVAKRPGVDQSADLDGHPLALYDDGAKRVDRAMAISYDFDEQARLQAKILSLQAQHDETIKQLQEAADVADGFRATVNDHCPVMKKNALGRATIKEHTVEFEGQTVGFCCDDCAAAWSVMTDDERRAALKAVATKAPAK